MGKGFVLCLFIPCHLGSSGCQELTQANTSRGACFKDVPAGIETGISRELRNSQPARPYQGRSRVGSLKVAQILRTALVTGFSCHPPELQDAFVTFPQVIHYSHLLAPHLLSLSCLSSYNSLVPLRRLSFQPFLLLPPYHHHPVGSDPTEKQSRSQIKMKISASEVIRLGCRTKCRPVVRGKNSIPSP